MTLHPIGILGSAVLAWELDVLANPSVGRDPRFSHFRDLLTNQLRVVTVEVPHLHSALLAVYVRSGSRHESEEVMGVSHFLEHMFFRGSSRFSDTAAMNALVESVGGNLNGVTSRDHGYYFTPLHPAEIGVGFDVLGDLLREPLLVELETERQIILEEMMDEVDETGRDVDLDNLSKMVLFPDNGLAHKVAGTPKTVRRIVLPDLQNHHARMYCAQNLVLCCAGKVDRQQVLDLAEKHFGSLPIGQRATEEAPLPPRPGPTVQLVENEDSPQTELRFNFMGPPEHHPDFSSLLLARRILDDGLSSRLPFEVVEKRGLAYTLHAGIDTFSDLSVFEIEAATAHEKVGKVVQACAEVLGKFVEEGPTEEELSRAKRRNRIFLEFSLDSCADLAGWFGGTELWRPAESFEDRLSRTEAVTVEQIRTVCQKVFARSNLHMVLVGRGGGRAESRLRRLVAELPLPR